MHIDRVTSEVSGDWLCSEGRRENTERKVSVTCFSLHTNNSKSWSSWTALLGDQTSPGVYYRRGCFIALQVDNINHSKNFLSLSSLLGASSVMACAVVLQYSFGLRICCFLFFARKLLFII